jgi:2-hydroxychromene-2-carboxylate isomerase
MKTIDCYFDLISPFTYLALQRLPGIAERNGYAVRYKAINLKEAKRLVGNIGPSTRDIPVKLAYAKIDQRRWAKRYDVPITTPAYYDSTRLNRGSFMAEARGQTYDYVIRAFHKVWGEGASMVDETMLRNLASELGWNENEFLDFTLSDVAEAQYQAATLAAHSRGVFGVPTFIVDDQLWWGNDRLDFVSEYLSSNA